MGYFSDLTKEARVAVLTSQIKGLNQQNELAFERTIFWKQKKENELTTERIQYWKNYRASLKERISKKTKHLNELLKIWGGMDL